MRSVLEDCFEGLDDCYGVRVAGIKEKILLGQGPIKNKQH